jgi:hypothetical protein
MKARSIKMKPGKMLMTVLLLLFVLPAYGGAAGLGELRLSLIDGDVQMRAEDTDEWVPAAINMPLRSGDQLWVPEGARTEIQARNGTVVRLDENTSLDILAIENSSLRFYLMTGQAYLNFRNLEDSVIQLDTPVSSARVYEPSKFVVTVYGNGDTDISVLKGRLYAESRSGKTQVGAGKMLSLGDGYADISPLGRANKWESWNKERDTVLERRGSSSQHLPDELEVYASDFENNGRWVYTSSYGHVWTPTVHISAGWAPYRHGRWTWVGSDYVWIAYEPWGWAPYHYGRWTFISSFGWCWVPPSRGAVYWGPGYVGWVHTPTYVAWVPLAPREIYYGYGYYGPHSVNIINVNVNRVVVKEVYRNVHVHNSVTIVHNETFLRGKKVDVNVRENPFLKEKINIGRPQIKPEKVTRMPVMKDIPHDKEPPGKVREVKASQIKQERGFVKERDRSVFSPDSSQRNLPVRRLTEPKTQETQERSIQRSVGQPGAGQMSPGERRTIEQSPGKAVEQPRTTPDRKPEIRRTPGQYQLPAGEPEKQMRTDERYRSLDAREIGTPRSEKEVQQERQSPPGATDQPRSPRGVTPETRTAPVKENPVGTPSGQSRGNQGVIKGDQTDARSPVNQRDILQTSPQKPETEQQRVRQGRQTPERVTEQLRTSPEMKPEIRRAPVQKQNQLERTGTPSVQSETGRTRDQVRTPETKDSPQRTDSPLLRGNGRAVEKEDSPNQLQTVPETGNRGMTAPQRQWGR